jgi:hypothetical protein
MSTPSNIRVFLHWSEQTVFAGEDIECQITFKNIASSTTRLRSSSAISYSFAPGGERHRKATTLQAPATNYGSSLSSTAQPRGRGHRSTLSLNVPASGAGIGGGPGSWSGTYRSGTNEHTHKRSVSIISLGASENATDDHTSQNSFPVRTRRPAKGHARAASLQIIPRRTGANGPTSGQSSYFIH